MESACHCSTAHWTGRTESHDQGDYVEVQLPDDFLLGDGVDELLLHASAGTVLNLNIVGLLGIVKLVCCRHLCVRGPRDCAKRRQREGWRA